MSAPAVEVSNLVMRYGDTVALDGLSLTVEAAAITAVLGPNGAGKTTMLEICEGYRTPQAGSVRVLGLDPVRQHGQLAPRLGVMLQSGGAWSGVRAHEMLSYVASLHAHPLPVGELADRLGLGSCGRTSYRRLSGGERQRLGLAMAVVGRPDIVFLDEPTAGLDPLVQYAFFEILREAKAEGRTVFLSSHIIEEVDRTCDRVAIIREGRLVQVDRIEAVRALAFHQVELQFGAPVPAADFETLPGVSHVLADGSRISLRVSGLMGPILRAAARHDLLDLVSREPNLEDVFLAQYGRSDALAAGADGSSSPTDGEPRP